MAAGLTLHRDNLDAFRERFSAYLEETTPPELFTPRLDIDLVATLDQLSLDLLDSYELVHPMGMGNPAPLFMSRSVRLAEEPRILEEKHLQASAPAKRRQARRHVVQRRQRRFTARPLGYRLPHQPQYLQGTLQRLCGS